MSVLQVNGSAVTSSSTRNNGGSAKVVAGNSNLSRSEWQSGEKRMPAVVGGVDGTNAADVTLLAGVNSLNNNGGYLQIELDNTVTGSLSVGQMVIAGGRGFRVRSIDSNQLFTVNEQFTGVSLSGNVYTVDGTYAEQAAGNYIMKKNNANVHGVANSTLQSGAADYGRKKVNKINALRTSRVATALRNGTYNIYTGEFSSDPTVANDYNNLDLDSSNSPDDETRTSSTGYGLKGEYSLNHGGSVVYTGDYEAKKG